VNIAYLSATIDAGIDAVWSVDAPGHAYSYEFAGQQPFPVRAYRGNVRLLPITSSGTTFIEWYGEFDCDADVVDRLTAAFAGIYAEFIDDLRHHLATKAP
jgi:hypothetical protein